MPSRSSTPKKEKKDFSQVAFDVVARLTGEKPAPDSKAQISEALDNAAVRREIMREMGRRGGQKGGRVRAERLTEAERKRIAKNAADQRWSREP